MENPKKPETVADAINKTFKSFLWVGETPEEIKRRNKVVGDDLISLQRHYNKRESHFADMIRYGSIMAPTTPKPPRFPRILALWRKIKWPLGLRIVHEDDICDCEDW